jgi:pyruvate/2-oxoglutarate dehydrogenase complex dihydrolipoamide acyltransferase (E2) component
MAERVFNLPDLGEGLEDAEIVEWKVAEGDDVELNQPLVEVNTAKALVEIPSPLAGVVASLHGAPGDVVAVGAPLVTFRVGAETAAPDSEGPVAEGQTAKREAVLVGYGVESQSSRPRRRRLTPPGPRTAAQAATPRRGGRATPPVRRLARERGVDLTVVPGSGPDGRITREDVLKAAGSGSGASAERGGPSEEGGAGLSAAPAAGAEERIPVRGVRRLIAQKMSRSWSEIPHVTTFHTADATHVEALRRELSEASGTKVSALAIVVRALVEVCRSHPLLNSSFDADAGEIVLKGSYHVGIATDTDRGLLVPVVRDTDHKGIVELADQIAGLVEAARSGTAGPDQLTGSTITVTNVGTYGSAFGTPIINHPEAAILALGRVEPRALVVDGEVTARPAVTLSLSFDHRVIDGADADRAMTALREIVESPFRLGALPR